ncbi:low specificity L-threonine aldolase [uncultured Enorma sp.]|uniref:threonine aldolase family protein n=1 Tax=uncultured Enorma sp. TaxID=1714346 RepID=UPI002592401B|nr:beta-eliminating lyase-related protein [uncultured Enorma sp.]
MHQLRNDYSEGAHPRILDALVRTNLEQTVGYGADEHCARAAELIRAEIGQPDAHVSFVPGGTPANILAITALTEEFEGPLCAADAHPTAHETGAIEAHGRRLLATRDPLGRLTCDGMEPLWEAACAMGAATTRPGMLYFSHTSELGYVYTRAEFDALCDWAEARDLAIYVDGARMASGCTAQGGDLTIQHIAARADAFTLGGTKNGMLFGEALVLSPRTARGRRAIERIPYLTKRAGQLSAKGRVMGVMFEAAFDPATRDETGAALYWQMARHANAMACRLAAGLTAAGLEPVIETTGNQQFFWVEPEVAEQLSATLGCELMAGDDPAGRGRVIVRFVTSWATPEAGIDEAIAFAQGL